MTAAGAYGERFAERFRLENVPSFVTRTLRQAELAVTEIRDDDPVQRMSESIPREDAFLVAVMMRDFPAHEYWEDGKKAPVSSLWSGDTVLYDLKRDPVVLLDKPFHSIHFYLPRAAFDALADEADARRIGDLVYQPGAGIRDPRMAHLGTVVQAAMERPEQASRLFVEHLILAVGVHVAQTYGGFAEPKRPPQGGLASWQEKRAKDFLLANLNGDFALKSLAQECGLSIGHFSRAFRKSTGLAPHQWLLRCRVENAKSLLRDSATPLQEIALMTGFADQSHFTRVFSRATGISPGVWRRSRKT
jgi:AraC-like DNA-binding protein